VTAAAEATVILSKAKDLFDLETQKIARTRVACYCSLRGETMNKKKLIAMEIEHVPEFLLEEVLDFVRFSPK
jgi:hypothetical protein